MKTVLLKLGWNGEDLSLREWVPWSSNSDTPEEMQFAAIRQAIRWRIGENTTYRGKPARLEVWRHDPETDLKHIPSGKPFKITQTIYHLNPVTS